MSAHDRLIDHLLGLLDEGEQRELQRELASSEALQSELRELREAFYTLPEAGHIEAAPEGAWLRIRAAHAGEQPDDRRAAPPGKLGASWVRPWLALAAALVLVTGAGLAWGGWERGRAARLEREQTTVAYWMLHPEIVILQLEAPPGDDPSGVVCLLPEGRSMLLQAHAPAGRGRYLLWGSSSGERTLIGETDGRLLVFDRGGFERLELELAPRRGADATPIGSLTLASDAPHNYD